MRARVNAAKAHFLRLKQSVDWAMIERDWDAYFKSEASTNWREEFHPLIVGTARDVNEVWTTELGIQFNVQNWLENAALELEAYEMTFAQPILDTTQSDLFALLKTARQEGWTIDRLDNAIDRLWAVYLQDETLTDDERQWFVDRTPRYRVELVARTESMHSANWASPQLFRAYGADRHEWVATNDARTRPTHAAANGQIRVIGQPFEVGGYLMLHPLDGSLGAPASEICNCRCVTAPVIEEGAELGEQAISGTTEPTRKPQGPAVSGGLKTPKSGKYKDTYQRAIDAIDSVHGDGELPELPVKTVSAKKSKKMGGFEAQYYRSLYSSNTPDPKANKITINSAGEHMEFTFIHEVGHYLDFQVLGGLDFGSTHVTAEGQLMHEWGLAVKNSEATQALVRKYKNPDSFEVEIVDDWGRGQHVYTSKPNKDHILYLLDNKELWARSYAQYIAEKSGDPVLLEQLDKERQDKVYGERHWSKEDFAPISKAIDDMFESLGWVG